MLPVTAEKRFPLKISKLKKNPGFVSPRAQSRTGEVRVSIGCFIPCRAMGRTWEVLSFPGCH